MAPELPGGSEVLVGIEGERKQAWIRLRGTSDDPESWDLASWNGIVWEVRRELPNGRRVTLQIRDYMVLEQLAPETSPAALYGEDDGRQ